MYRMNLKVAGILLGSLLLLGVLMAACGDATSTASPVQPTPSTPPATTAATTAASTTATSNTTAAVTTGAATVTPVAATTAPATTNASTTNAAPATTVAATTNAPTSAPAQATTAPGSTNSGTAVDVNSKLFIDDRSDPVQVLRSFYNAINRKEYVRAYSYWNAPDANGNDQVQPYAKFEAGYKDTASVELSIGTITGDAGASQRYWSVPVVLKATNTSGAAQNFVGCYVLHQSVPAVFGAPPFVPMQLNQATVQTVAAGANIGQLLGQACKNSGNGPANFTPSSADSPVIDASRYLDDRSSALEVVRSYYNAINRKEYVRAYSYWSAGAVSQSQVQPYPKFEEGYKTTASVQLNTGTVTSGAAAGTVYYQVPVALVSRLIGDRVQTFVGCFTVKQPQPANFGAPPFTPMGFDKADLKEVAANADTNALMNQACK